MLIPSICRCAFESLRTAADHIAFPVDHAFPLLQYRLRQRVLSYAAQCAAHRRTEPPQWPHCLCQEPTVVAALEAVQASLVAHDARLKRACVAACTAHITLGVMHLGSGA